MLMQHCRPALICTRHSQVLPTSIIKSRLASAQSLRNAAEDLERLGGRLVVGLGTMVSAQGIRDIEAVVAMVDPSIAR